MTGLSPDAYILAHSDVLLAHLNSSQVCGTCCIIRGLGSAEKYKRSLQQSSLDLCASIISSVKAQKDERLKSPGESSGPECASAVL
jgi:hypothetical protein